MDQQEKGTERNFSRIDVFALALGVMVGWGAFAMPGTTFLPVAGPAGTLIALAVGAAIMMVIASNFAFLMERSPRSGGVYAYTREAFGRDHAFLASWFLCLSYLTIVFLNGTALFIVIRTMADGAMENGIHYTVAGNTVYLKEVLVSALAFAVIGLLFVRATPFLRKLFRVLAFVLVIGAAVTAAFCIPFALQAGTLSSFGTRGLNRGYAVFTLVVLAPWAFVGFDTVCFDTPRFRFPSAGIRRVLFIAVLVAALIYAAMAVVGVSFVPEGYADWGGYVAATNDPASSLRGIAGVPVFNAVAARMGTAGRIVIAVTALAAIFTGIIGAYHAATRVLSAMAEDRILSEQFTRTRTSILFIMVISVLLSMLGRNTLNWFVDLTSFGAIVGFGYTSAAAWKIARTERDRKTMVLGMAGTVISVILALVQLVPRISALETMGAEAFLLLALWCLLGFIFYLRTVNGTALSEFTGMSVSGIVLFALLLYASLMWAGKQLAAADPSLQRILFRCGIVLVLLMFSGLAVMTHVQNLIRKKHEAAEREKIRAVEGSLAKSQFLFNMSHDIRTPMNAIIGYTGLALKENDPGALHDYLSKIDMSSHHLLTLINDILEMSRIENGQVELEFVPTDLRALFRDMRDLFAEQMERKRLAYAVHTSLVQHPFVWCDRKNLTRVLLNVISNAWKFTPEGGEVSVSLQESGAGQPEYGAYEIRVRDSGIGMSGDFVEKMFNAFEREHTSTASGVEGTGLGLAITKRIVDLMGGTIEVFTAPASGTEIVIRASFRLARQDDLPGEAPPAEDENPVDFSTKRLLLVEDNEINMEIACMILAQKGFTVETAGNGRIAVEKVAASAPGYYDLILMDIQMPVMDGYEATRAIRGLADPVLARIPIVAMTANAFAEDVQAAKDAGMQAHIAKPVDIGVLTHTLQDVLKANQ